MKTMKEVYLTKEDVIAHSKKPSPDAKLERFVDYSTYLSACRSINSRDVLLDNLVEVVKEHGKTSTNPYIREAAMSLVLKVAQLRAM